MSFIARVRSEDKAEQTLYKHLSETGELAAVFASKVGLYDTGLLLGILHDFGKYSQAFQTYIRSAAGCVDPDDVQYIDASKFKGKIDHATAGAQYIYDKLKDYGNKGQGELCGQIMSLCIASHHSGLIDVLAADFEKGNVFNQRINKDDSKSHLRECINNADDDLIVYLESLLSPQAIKHLLTNFTNKIKPILGSPKTANSVVSSFQLGMLARFLFSCLIDADRLSSAEFEERKRFDLRLTKPDQPDWDQAIERLDTRLKAFAEKTDPSPIDHIRCNISDECHRKAFNPRGLYTLTVPTGGGKTLASLRYALQHAQQHQLERIFYIIPYTTIIEQNAADIRDILEQEGDEYPWVLEHHSNIEPDKQTWHSKISGENWDAPIVVTTMVQFLEVLFSGGTKNARRLHQLANSVLIFDEIQTLPVKCTHLFCNALNFLVDHAGSSAVLCTATQPLLDQLHNADKGQLTLSGELIDDVSQCFDELKRVHIENRCRDQGWSEDEIVDFALLQFYDNDRCLVVTNTKQWAQTLYQRCEGVVDSDALFHLSTNLCVAHRKQLLARIRARLDQELPVLCFSTQLIEAGVDVDFGCVIRFLAGLDSIAQASGRCNRHGRRELDVVYVINPDTENTNMLVDIDQGKRQAERVMGEDFDDLLMTESMSRYFTYYFFQRSDEMLYPCKDSNGQKNSVLRMLANNAGHPCGSNHKRKGRLPLLEQSFMEAGKAFQVIDAPTQAVIVPFDPKIASFEATEDDWCEDDEFCDGNRRSDESEKKEELSAQELINQLCSAANEFDLSGYRQLLRQAQKYSVNVFPNVWKELVDARAVHEIQPGAGVYYLDKEYYHEDFGLSTEPVTLMASFMC